MNYLFFDLECASQRGGSKICEFGYVMTDDKFNITDRNNFIINPDIPGKSWDWYVVKKILTREKKEYLDKPTFDNYYPQIKKLFDKADYVFGHSTNGDAMSLNDELKRYCLPPIDFKFYDVKLFYKGYSNVRRDVSVEDMMKKLNVEGGTAIHDAEIDSLNEMLELKQMLAQLEVSFDELVYLCNIVPGSSKSYKVVNSYLKWSGENKVCDGTNLIKSRGINRIRFDQFIRYVEPDKIGNGIIKDRKVTISTLYEKEHYKQMLNLIQMITNEGGKYSKACPRSGIFVRYDLTNEDGSLRSCKRLEYVNEQNVKGKNIQIVTLDELLGILNISEKELDDLPIPSFELVFKRMKEERQKQRNGDNKKKNNTNSTFTLGDAFKDYMNEEGDE